MLALIAGAGALPAAIVQAAETPPLICAVRGFAPDGLTPDLTLRIETLGSTLQDLKARGVTRICLCGHISRPTIDLAALDEATLPLVPRLRDALRLGDDGALRALIGILEEAGFALVAAQAAAPALLPPPGGLGEVPFAPDAEADAALGDAVLADQGAADLGQACIIVNGQVAAREDQAGTDAMLAAYVDAQSPDAAVDPFGWAMDTAGDVLGAAADWLSGLEGGPRKGILFKGPKPGQDRRADLPVIGPQTVQGVAQAGLAGIVIEAGGVMVLDRPRVVAMADRAGLFLWVRPGPL